MKREAGWSDPPKSYERLAELGVKEHHKGARHNWTDGECDIWFINSKGYMFQLNSNYYDKECFTPVIEWALANRT